MNVGTKHENEVELRVARGLDQVDNGEETRWGCQNRTEQNSCWETSDSHRLWLLLVES